MSPEIASEVGMLTRLGYKIPFMGGGTIPWPRTLDSSIKRSELNTSSYHTAS